MYWTTKSRPIIKPKAVWTKEEDKKLLALDEKYYGRWWKVPDHLMSHTPHECNVRLLELTYPHLQDKSTHTIRPKITVINESPLVSEAHEESENYVIEIDSDSALEATPEIDTAVTISSRNKLESSLDRLANDLDRLDNDPAFVKEWTEGDKEWLTRWKDKESILKMLPELPVLPVENLELSRTDNTQQQIETKEGFSKKHSADTGDAHSLTKHVDSSFINLDRPSKRLKTSSSLDRGEKLSSLFRRK